jgi:hypothetical protein
MGNFALFQSLTCMDVQQTAVNTKMGKNLVGAFHQPTVVFMDMGFRESLLVPGFTRKHKEHDMPTQKKKKTGHKLSALRHH